MSSSPSHTSDAAHGAAEGDDKIQAFQDFLAHHVMDSHHWELPFLDIHTPAFITVHGIMLLIGTAFLCLLFGVVYKRKDDVPRGMTNLLESFIIFVRDEISIANLGEEDGRKFTPFFCSMFFFVLMLNLMGLIPLFSTATSNLAVTAALSMITLGAIISMGIARHGALGFLKSFAPPGVPLAVLVILYPIEILGTFIKAFALTIRLFANMLAGHIVIFSILGMVLLFGALVALPAALLATAIYFLEIFVAFLQAYIFVLLSSMFIGASLHPEH
ncbi:MAG: F0F1 ATP synthase subunit A [Verrucomicrobia bacterium]|nr:F0F1 ATP synthase subunit A [Verrucomicrobiota bacterium]MDA1085867.1 F0F1 ATP synthase subunit A [Verrucomicrobiota bacterium]